MLTIHLFGKMHLQHADSAPMYHWPRRQTKLLLAYLVLHHGEAVSQELLCDLLFPNTNYDKAIKSLRSRLSELRKLLEPTLSHGTHSRFIRRAGKVQYMFIAKGECWVDTIALEQHLYTARALFDSGRWNDSLQNIQDGLDVYQGPLLDDEPDVEWLNPLRRQCLEQVVAAELLASQCAQKLDEPKTALRYLNQVIQRNPVNEHVAGSVIEQLRQQILAGNRIGKQRKLYHLPHESGGFFGREIELKRLTHWLDQSDRRPIELIGPGGVGKSRLALRAARKALQKFPGGAVWISVEQQLHTSLLEAITQTLEASDNSIPPSSERLQGHVDAKPALLIVDDLVASLEVVDDIQAILTHWPTTQIIVTTRLQLSIPDARRLIVKGLSLDAINQQDQAAWPPAQALFAHRASHLQSLEIDVQKNAVNRICRLVAGHPLGIELAAAWVSVFSCTTIADEIEAYLEQSKANNLDDRLQAVFRFSYNALSAEEQKILRTLISAQNNVTDLDRLKQNFFSKAACQSLIAKSILKQRKGHPQIQPALVGFILALSDRAA